MTQATATHIYPTVAAWTERLGLTMRAVPRWHWRRGLQVGLAVLWLLDAALQYQPYMFTRAFPREAIAPTADGNPAWVAAPVTWAAGLLGGHVVVFNALFATVQLLIALCLFWRPTVKVGLVVSIVWSLLVWWLGEGLGGVLAGPVSPLAGLPGAVVLYALIAVLLWPHAPQTPTSIAEASPLRPSGARAVWILLWAAFAFEALRPANRAPGAVHDLIANAAGGEPSWLSTFNGHIASAAAGHGTLTAVILAAACVAVGLSVLVPRLSRVGVVLAVLLAAAIWIVGEDLGAIATGTGTDPNSGLPLMLLALCYWPVRQREARPS